MIHIRVEFYGIPRQRSGQAEALLALPGDGTVSLGQVLGQLAERFPELAAECFSEGQRLRPGYAGNLGGERFVSDPGTLLGDGDCLLILSADAGG